MAVHRTRDAELPRDYSEALDALSLGPLWTALHVRRIGDATFTWEPGDTFVAPPRHWIEHRNADTAPACLFQFNDEPALSALGLYEEETRG